VGGEGGENNATGWEMKQTRAQEKDPKFLTKGGKKKYLIDHKVTDFWWATKVLLTLACNKLRNNVSEKSRRHGRDLLSLAEEH